MSSHIKWKSYAADILGISWLTFLINLSLLNRMEEIAMLLTPNDLHFFPMLNNLLSKIFCIDIIIICFSNITGTNIKYTLWFFMHQYGYNIIVQLRCISTSKTFKYNKVSFLTCFKTFIYSCQIILLSLTTITFVYILTLLVDFLLVWSLHNLLFLWVTFFILFWMYWL